MKKVTKRVRSAKSVKATPFQKKESHAALGFIVALTVFNLVYSYAAGLPLPRAVVASYVEAVHELGDLQVRGYEALGAAIVAVVTLPQEMQTAAAVEADYSNEKELESPPPPEPILVIAPNQISIAK